jgi:hypothetical protein
MIQSKVARSTHDAEARRDLSVSLRVLETLEIGQPFNRACRVSGRLAETISGGRPNWNLDIDGA